jgi:hypothetical protein
VLQYDIWHPCCKKNSIQMTNHQKATLELVFVIKNNTFQVVSKWFQCPEILAFATN